MGELPAFGVQVEELVVDEGAFGLEKVKVHVRLQPLGLDEVVGSSTVKDEASVGIGSSKATRVQKINGLAKILVRLHFGTKRASPNSNSSNRFHQVQFFAVAEKIQFATIRNAMNSKKFLSFWW